MVFYDYPATARTGGRGYVVRNDCAGRCFCAAALFTRKSNHHALIFASALRKHSTPSCRRSASAGTGPLVLAARFLETGGNLLCFSMSIIEVKADV